MQLNRREFLNVMAAGSACGMFGSWASAAQAAAKGERLYDIPRAGNVSFYTSPTAMPSCCRFIFVSQV